jgi:WW domain
LKPLLRHRQHAVDSEGFPLPARKTYRLGTTTMDISRCRYSCSQAHYSVPLDRYRLHDLKFGFRIWDASCSLDRKIPNINATLLPEAFFPMSSGLEYRGDENLHNTVVKKQELNPLATSSLPPGWKIRHTQEDRIYYVQHNTHITQWQSP